MSDKPKFYVTTAISYTNGKPHVGHAYEIVATDAIARFKRLEGYDVFFLTGTDEHGQKVQRAAEVLGVRPEDYVTELSDTFRNMAASLNCSFDRFIRTSEQEHVLSAQELWRRMEANGDIYLSVYAGWYSVRDEAFYDEEETILGEDGVRRGAQGTPVEWIEEESYFFRLSKYQDKLLDLYRREKDFVRPASRRNEVISFVERGLKDLSISRTTFSWGVPVPGNERHIMYVWVDALNNYLTGCHFPDKESPYRRYWPADLHIVGKDIIRFHAVYWPAFLMSAQLETPACVFGHGFLLSDGEKMSKSTGNVLDPFHLIDQYGSDQLRYFFLRETPFGQDGHYSEKAVIRRINADLANDLGNLVQRSLSMIARNLESVSPKPDILMEEDKRLLEAADGLLPRLRSALGNYALHAVLERLWWFIGEVNRYFSVQAPWALRKTNPVRMETVLYVTAESLRQIGILLQPFMPEASSKILTFLAIPEDKRDFINLGRVGRLPFSTPFPAPQPIFPRSIASEEMK